MTQDIFQLIEDNDLEGIKTLLEKDPSQVILQNEDGNTTLHISILNDNKQLFNLLMDYYPIKHLEDIKNFAGASVVDLVVENDLLPRIITRNVVKK